MSSETTEVSTSKEQQPTDSGQIFEHLFPGSKFRDLPNINPLTPTSLLKFYMWDVGVESDEFRKAMNNQEGFAYRCDFPQLDKLTVLSYLSYIIPTAENSMRFRGWVNDLLNKDEQLGRVGTEPWSYVPANRSHQYQGVFQRHVREILSDPRTWISHIRGQKMKEYEGFSVPVPIRIFGIVGSDGKPRGIIHFVEGPRPDRGERIKKTAMVSKLATGNVVI